MPDNVMYLDGADAVRSAARTMDQAASKMESAASSLNSALERFLWNLDERINRLEEILEKNNARNAGS